MIKITVHSIIVIKNENGEYLQYYDNIWNSLLFPNCKLEEGFSNQTIVEYITNKLGIEKSKISCEYVGKKTHTKFSESAKKDKEYIHYFYNVKIEELPNNMRVKEFIINSEKYIWCSYNELYKDERVQKTNSDVLEFVKEFNI